MRFIPDLSGRGYGNGSVIILTRKMQLIILLVVLMIDFLFASESGNLGVAVTAETVAEQQTCSVMPDGSCVAEDHSNTHHDSYVQDKIDGPVTESQDGSKSNNDSSVNNLNDSSNTLLSKENSIPPVPSADEEGYVDTGYGEDQLIEGEEATDNTAIQLRLTEMHSYMHSVVYVDKPLYIQNLCRNLHELCTFWASVGECETNPDYMISSCAPACFSCDQLSIPSVPVTDIDGLVDTGYGEHQRVVQSDEEVNRAIQRRLDEMHEYMHTDVYVSQPYTLKEDCLNRHEDCTFWASSGECENNPDYMTIQCAPACFTCDKLVFENRCPMPDNIEEQNVWNKGDLNRMFENIVTNPYYQQQYGKMDVILRPGMKTGALTDSPWVVVIDDFVSPEECDALINYGADKGYEISEDVGERNFDGTYGATRSSGRTSTNAWCGFDCYYNNTLTQNVLHKIENLTGIPDDNSEFLQLLRYEVGQFYETHHDYIEHNIQRQQGVRILTVFLYLNDVEAGGGTNFPTLDVTVMPKRGRALIWPSVKDNLPNYKDYRTEHQALPVEKGIKYGANAWVHQRDFKTPFNSSCI